MSRPISESLSLLSETLGNCKTNLKEKEVVDVDNIKISDIDEKIAEIQAGGGGEDNVVFADNYKFSQVLSKLSNNSILKVVNDKAPDDSQTTDVSIDGDGSVVAWKSDNTLYLSSQNEKKVHFNDLSSVFNYNDYLGGGSYDSVCPFSEIYLDNLSVKYNCSFIYFFYGSDLKIIDISKLDWNFKPYSGKKLENGSGVSAYPNSFFSYVFNYCSSLTTIYSQPLNELLKDWDYQVFRDCTSLPNWDNSNTHIDMCKYKEDGGYFTNPAEREN